MAGNAMHWNFKQWFNIFLIISEVWQGYESKAYGVSNHNLKLQSKKLSRTRDIPNFPTQGWAGTAFCTRKRSETYIYSPLKYSQTLIYIYIYIQSNLDTIKLKCSKIRGSVKEVFQPVSFKLYLLQQTFKVDFMLPLGTSLIPVNSLIPGTTLH